MRRPLLSPQQLRERIIRTSVKDIQDFGYPHCNEANIIKDPVYSLAFKMHLRDAREKVPSATIREALDGITKEITDLHGEDHAKKFPKHSRAKPRHAKQMGSGAD